MQVLQGSGCPWLSRSPWGSWQSAGGCCHALPVWVHSRRQRGAPPRPGEARQPGASGGGGPAAGPSSTSRPPGKPAHLRLPGGTNARRTPPHPPLPEPQDSRPGRSPRKRPGPASRAARLGRSGLMGEGRRVPEVRELLAASRGSTLPPPSRAQVGLGERADLPSGPGPPVQQTAGARWGDAVWAGACGPEQPGGGDSEAASLGPGGGPRGRVASRGRRPK